MKQSRILIAKTVLIIAALFAALAGAVALGTIAETADKEKVVVIWRTVGLFTFAGFLVCWQLGRKATEVYGS